MTPLSDSERTEVRRHCGYPPRGNLLFGQPFWGCTFAGDLLELRMSNLTNPEISVVRRYLGTLTNLEAGVPRSSESMDTDQASVWTRNRNEAADRAMLFDQWRMRLCAFLGVPFGPAGTVTNVHWKV